MSAITRFFKSVGSAISSGFKRIWAFSKRHKIVSTIILLIVVFAAYKTYAGYEAKNTATQYSLARAMDQSIAVTVSGSGGVESSHELSLSPKASGTLTSVTVKPGDKVVAGQVIATVDATDAENSLRDAQLNLQSARVSYQTSLSSANDTTETSNVSLDTARDSGYDAAAKAENDFATTLQQLKTLVHDNFDSQQYVDDLGTYDPSINTTRDSMNQAYDAATASYAQTLSEYQQASRSNSPTQIAALLTDIGDTASKISQATASAQAFLQEANNAYTIHNSIVKPSSLATDSTTANTLSTSAQSDASNIRSAQSSLTSAQNSVDQNTQSLSGSGGTTLSIESAQLALQKAENAYTEAEDTLADYSVIAPFSGTIGSVSLQKYDQAGGSTAVATLITDAQLVTLSLNETDIANVRVGQPVDLTFDALEGVTATGTVAEINQVGTVSQNVTTYGIEVAFTSSDTRIKPGMTAEATITTASKDNALVIPVSALKTRTVGNETQYYVQEIASGNVGGTGSTTAGRMRMVSSSGTFSGAGGTFGSSTMRYGFGSASSTGGYTRGSGRASGATTVPVSSVTLREVPVTIGLQNDEYVEITNGITPGTQVVSGTLNASGSSTTQSKGLFSSLFGSSRRTTSTTGTRTTTGSTRTTSSGFGGGAGGPPGGF